ncbi:MAG: carboxypeptidase-like regulatory domain-containing protein, partial [Rhodopirellula sp. JB044]|uniref:carboxypeptidase-like regulatory domain-containing protein n=1 Tax=Rhodopirellula sp. JB044 TaxID=3342844 RepID=UPI003709E7D6
MPPLHLHAFCSLPLVMTLLCETEPLHAAERTHPSNVDQSSVRTTLHGVVKDTSENILPGVTIRVRGNEAAYHSDGDGKFTVSIEADATIRLTFSKEGYNDKHLFVKDTSSTIDAAMVPITDDTGLIQHTAMISM